MTPLELVDNAVSGRVLVFGSLPPEGRDLDLLVRPADVDAVRAALLAAGFTQCRGAFARFPAGGRPELVDLVSLREFRLPRGEGDALLDGAISLPGCRSVARPAPHHTLLLLARAYARDRRLSASRRARAEAAGSEDALAWSRAASVAASWGLADELAALQAALAGTVATPVVVRVAGRARRVRRAAVVAISGLDGAGKSAQARALRDTLEAIGVDATIEWHRFSHDAWLDAVAKPVKRLLRPSPGVTGSSGASGEPGVPGDPRLRRRPPFVGSLWILVVALANAVSHLRDVAEHRVAGRLVICDRYVLDSVVQLRDTYPPGAAVRLAAALIRWLSPRPRVAFFLDVPASEARGRKPSRLPLARTERQAELYRSAYARLGVIRVDGTQPPDVLAAEIARHVWLALH